VTKCRSYALAAKLLRQCQVAAGAAAAVVAVGRGPGAWAAPEGRAAAAEVGG